MHRNLLALMLTLLLVPALWACSDDTGVDPKPDMKVADQAIADQKVTDQKVTDQKITDQKVIDQTIIDQTVIDQTVIDQTVVDQTVADKGTDSAVTPDMAALEGGVVYLDGATPDNAVTTPDSSVNPSCSLTVQKTLTLTNGKASVSGEVRSTDKPSAVNLTSTGCTKQATLAFEHIYAVNLTKGTKYAVILTHNSDYNAGFYVFTDCSKVGTSCVAGTDVMYGSDLAESTSFTAAVSGIHYIGVDSRYAPAATYSYGTYNLYIKEVKKPANDACSGALMMTFSGGKASAFGTTELATDDSNLTSTGCTKNTTAGPDVFYKIKTVKGVRYDFQLLSGDFNGSLYLFTNCASIASTCGTGMGKDSSSYPPEKISYTATAAGTLFIAVDGRAATDKGGFELTVEKVEKPANDTCATATTLTLSNYKASVKGNNLLATNTINLPTTGCTKYDTEGADVFYKLALTAGKTYRFKVTPDSSFSSFNPALYLLSSCSSTACLKGADTSSYTSAETFTYTPTTTGDHTIVVDTREASTSSYATGKFTLDVQEVVVPANDTCAKASALTFTSGKATGTGDTTDATATLDLTSSGCTSKDTEGQDLFYSVTLKANQAYKVTVTPASGYDVAAYMLSSCSATACVKGADSGSSSSAESFTYTPTTAGTYTIGVDSSYAATSSYGTGTFTINVEEFTPAAGDTCSKAIAMTWASGKATASGDTTNATNTQTFASSTGCTDTTGKGNDLFYKVAVTSGKKYQVKVTPTDSTYDVAAYVFGGCAKPLATCLGGADNTSSGSVEKIMFTATSTGNVIIGVDSYSTTKYGKFTIEVSEAVAPANDTCAKASALTFTSGKASTTGDTSLATNTVQVASSTGSCTSQAVKGSDLWYSFTAVKGKYYTITATPSTSPSYNVAFMVLPACATTGAACIKGADAGYSGTAESASFTATTAGTHYIVITSQYTPLQYSYANGTFTLAVEEGTAPVKPSNDLCANAEALTFTSGTATATGDTTLASHEVNMSGATCGTSSVYSSPGNDVFYKATLTAGQAYTVTLTPAATYDSSVYVFTDCSKVTTSCLGFHDPFGSGYVGTVKFTPTTTGVYYFGVDSYSSSEKGKFTITVK